jgi:hypothetical protein
VGALDNQKRKLSVAGDESEFHLVLHFLIQPLTAGLSQGRNAEKAPLMGLPSRFGFRRTFLLDDTARG